MKQFSSFLALYLTLVLGITFGLPEIMTDQAPDESLESRGNQPTSLFTDAWQQGDVRLRTSDPTVHNYRFEPADVDPGSATPLDWVPDPALCAISFGFAPDDVVRRRVMTESEMLVCWRTPRGEPLF